MPYLLNGREEIGNSVLVIVLGEPEKPAFPAALSRW